MVAAKPASNGKALIGGLALARSETRKEPVARLRGTRGFGDAIGRGLQQVRKRDGGVSGFNQNRNSVFGLISASSKETIVTIATRLTRRFRIKHPIVVAPMTPASGGDLASAVAAAGGLGLLGCGYVDRAWFEAESAKVTRSEVGAGFITWSIPDDPGLLDIALERHPRAVMLSFSNPAPYATRIKKAGVPLICQVHTLDHALQAVDVGADVVVAQGAEEGGRGWALRSMMPFVPSVVDAFAARAPDVLVLAAGGIADGRGLAASLMLGADGVLMGTSFSATQESLVPGGANAKLMAVSRDEIIRASEDDFVRERIWPPSHTGRVMRVDFAEKRGQAREARDSSQSDYCEAANISIGTAYDIPKTSDLINRIVAEASERLMAFAPRFAAQPAVVEPRCLGHAAVSTAIRNSIQQEHHRTSIEQSISL
jgi:nitronate monooxygenase